MDGPAPAVDRVRLRQAVGGVVPQDVLLKGVGHHAKQTPFCPVPLHDRPDALIGHRDMVLHILAPEVALLLQVLIAHAVFLPAHGDEARVKVLEEIVLQGAAPSRIMQGQILLKAGVMDGGGAVHHRVVMVEYQAFISHSVSRLSVFLHHTISCPL